MDGLGSAMAKLIAATRDRVGDMGQQGFTNEELRTIFNLDPHRPQDRSAIAALRASSTRQLAEASPPRRPRALRSTAMQLLRKRCRRAA